MFNKNDNTGKTTPELIQSTKNENDRVEDTKMGNEIIDYLNDLNNLGTYSMNDKLKFNSKLLKLLFKRFPDLKYKSINDYLYLLDKFDKERTRGCY